MRKQIKIYLGFGNPQDILITDKDQSLFDLSQVLIKFQFKDLQIK